MKDYIEERAIEIANFIIEEKATVRQTAKKFGVSKSTVHKDVTGRSICISMDKTGKCKAEADCTRDVQLLSLFERNLNYHNCRIILKQNIYYISNMFLQLKKTQINCCHWISLFSLDSGIL